MCFGSKTYFRFILGLINLIDGMVNGMKLDMIVNDKWKMIDDMPVESIYFRIIRNKTDELSASLPSSGLPSLPSHCHSSVLRFISLYLLHTMME